MTMPATHLGRHPTRRPGHAAVATTLLLRVLLVCCLSAGSGG